MVTFDCIDSKARIACSNDKLDAIHDKYHAFGLEDIYSIYF